MLDSPDSLVCLVFPQRAIVERTDTPAQLDKTVFQDFPDSRETRVFPDSLASQD
jgi:hypothetical protein